MARVLVVNDERDLVDLCKLILDGAGHVAKASAGGRRIVEMARRFRPDVILLDWVMPELTGEDAARLLRADPATAEIPIVLMTALSDGAERARRLGVQGILPKPFDERQLLASVAAAARAAESERGDGAATGMTTGDE